MPSTALMGKEMKERFILEAELERKPSHLIVAIMLPTGAIEVIHNTECIKEKVAYYTERYDDEFRLKANPEIQVMDYMLL
jgi:hypothetical protein